MVVFKAKHDEVFKKRRDIEWCKFYHHQFCINIQ